MIKAAIAVAVQPVELLNSPEDEGGSEPNVEVLLNQIGTDKSRDSR